MTDVHHVRTDLVEEQATLVGRGDALGQAIGLVNQGYALGRIRETVIGAGTGQQLRAQLQIVLHRQHLPQHLIQQGLGPLGLAGLAQFIDQFPSQFGAQFQVGHLYTQGHGLLEGVGRGQFVGQVVYGLIPQQGIRDTLGPRQGLSQQLLALPGAPNDHQLVAHLPQQIGLFVFGSHQDIGGRDGLLEAIIPMGLGGGNETGQGGRQGYAPQPGNAACIHDDFSF
ncbi:MAG: hypothetical protein U5S82_18555 [Gammaproteobacteria bacterium]|nr:hypothetical protein [Gammaproteobacteria bacterium]